MQADRVPGLEQKIKDYTKELEQTAFENSGLKQKLENKETEMKQVKAEADRANALAQQAIHDQENLRQKITDQS